MEGLQSEPLHPDDQQPEQEPEAEQAAAEAAGDSEDVE